MQQVTTFETPEAKRAMLAKYALFGRMRTGVTFANVLLDLTMFFAVAFAIIPFIEIIIVRVGAELVLSIVCTAVFGSFLVLGAIFQLYNHIALRRIPLFDIFVVSNHADQARIWIVAPILAVFIITMRWIVYARIGNIKDFADPDGSIYGAMTLANVGLILVFILTVFSSVNSYAMKTHRDRRIEVDDTPVFLNR